MELRLAALLFACACIGIVSAGPRRFPVAPVPDDQLLDLLKDICAEVKDEVRDHVPAKFAELVHSLKSLPRATIARIDKQVHGAGFCASSKIVDIWNDALIMDASEGSLKLIAEQIIKKEVSPARANYLFTMMAFSRNPTSGAVRAVLPILEEKDVPRQALLGISALIRNTWTGTRPQQTPEIRDAVKAIVKYMERNIKHQDRVVVALKALQNIGAIDEAMDKVIRMASDPSHKSGVRVAAIEALRVLSAQQKVTDKCMEIFQNTQESSEIRIAAYKIVIESRDRNTVQRIVQTVRKEENKQVGAFVSTHLKNLRDSSSPRHETVRQMLQDEKIPIERFPQDLRKYSRNFELSQYIERLGLGGVFDADLIYDKSFAPRSVRMNLTVPISEGEFNMFEFGFRQVGLEEEIRKLVGPHLKGRNAPEIMTEVLAEIVDLFDQESLSNEVQTGRFARNVQRRQNVFHKLNAKDDVEAAFYLNVDGKAIAYFDIADLTHPDNDMTQVIRSLVQEIKRSDKVDRAYSFMFMKKEFEVPSGEGKKPVAVNGTIIFALKGDKNTFVPSVAVEMSTRIADKKYLQRVSSSVDLRFDVEYKNSRPVKVAFKLPKESHKLIRLHSAVFDVDQRGVETPSSVSYKKMSKCTTSLTRPLGLEICAKIATPDEMLSNGIPPFNGLWEFELLTMKTDRHMSGWEVAVEMPQAGDNEQTYRFSFETPNGRVDRRTAILLRSYDQSRGLQLKLESPFFSWDASANCIKSSNEWSTKSELTMGNQDKYSFEAGISKNTKSKKLEWIPVFRVSAPSMQPIALTGAVSMTRGRKSQLNFELRSENDEKRFLKGSVVQEGVVSIVKDFRLASDIQADFGPISFRVFSSAEQQANSISTDLKVDYQTPNSRKHSIKLVGKLHNLSTASYAKVNSFVEAQISQYPEANFHVSWNVLIKPQEHLENELTVMWSGQMRDQNKKIHILQVSKATGLATGRAVSAENILSVEIAPIHFKYEFKASGSMERSLTPKYKVQWEMNNKNDKSDDVQASFEVQHISSEPFKMTLDAAFITAARELRYSDKLEEVSPRVFKGRTQIQWQQDKKTTIGYTLKVKSDKQNTDLEMDAEIKTPSMRHGLRHQGAVRSSRSSIEIKSKVYYEKSVVWDIQSMLQRQGKSMVMITMKGFEGKAEAVLSSPSKSVVIDLKGKDFAHHTELLMAKEAVTFTSKTVSDQKPVLRVEMRNNGKDTTRVNFDCSMFEAQADLSGRGESPVTVRIEFKGKTGDKLALKTKGSFSMSEGLELSAEGKSDSIAPYSAVMNIKRSANGLSITGRSEQNSQQWFVGSVVLEELVTGLHSTAHLSQWGQEVARFKSQLHRNVLAGPHDVEINFRPEASSELLTLKIHHEIGNGEAKCVVTYFVDGKQKGQFENFGRFRSSRWELDVAAGITLKSEVKYQGLDGVQLSFQHKHKNERLSFTSETQVKGQVSDEQKYELALTSGLSGNRKVGKASIKLALETPLYDFKQQSSQWVAEWTEDKVTLDHKTLAKEVSIIVETVVRKADLISGPHYLKVETSLPRSVPWSLVARHELVKGNLRSNAEYKVNGKKQMSAQADGQLKNRNGQIDFYGPHDVEIKFQTASSDAQSLKWHTEAQNGHFKCLLSHLVEGQEKQRLENEAQFRFSDLFNCEITADLSLKSELYKELDGCNVHFQHAHKFERKSSKIDTEWTGQRAENKYQIALNFFGNSDRMSCRINAETPIRKFEKQSAELNYRWFTDKITMDSKVKASMMNIMMKTVVNDDLISGPHDLNLEFDVPRVQRFSAIVNHQKFDGVLKTKVVVKELDRQTVIFSAASQLQPTRDRITGKIEGQIRDKRFSHESEFLTKSDEVAYESKTFWQNKPITTIKGRIHETEPCFAEIDCPIFQLRADSDFPTTGSLVFKNKIGQREELKGNFEIKLGKSVEVHAEGKSRSVPEYVMDLKTQTAPKLYSAEYMIKRNGKELSGGEGQINWQKDVRANARVTWEGKDFGRFDISSNNMEVQFRPESSSQLQSLKIQQEVRNGEMKCVLSYRVSEDRKYELALTTGRSGNWNVGKANFKLALETPISDFRQQSTQWAAQWTREKVTLDHKTTAKDVSIFFETSIRTADLVSGPHSLKCDYVLPRSYRRSLVVNHEMLNGKLNSNAEYKLNGKRHLSAQADGQLKNRNGQIDFYGPHDVEIKFQTASSESQSLKLHHEAKNGDIKCLLTHLVEGQEKQRLENQARFRCSDLFNCEISADLSLKSELYKELDGSNAHLAHEHKVDRKSVKVETKVTTRCADDKYQFSLALFGNGDRNQGKMNLKVNAETPVRRFEKQTAELNYRWFTDKITMDSKIKAAEINIMMKTMLNENLISGPHDFNLEFDVPRVQRFSAVIGHQMSSGNFKTNVEVKELGRQRVIFNAASQWQQTRERMAGKIEGQIRNKRFSHESDLLTKSDEVVFESKTIWQNKPVTMIKSRIHATLPCFVEIDCPVFELRADTDRTHIPATGSIVFRNKMGQKEELKYSFVVKDKSVEVHAEGKSRSIPEYIVDLKSRTGAESYAADYMIKRNGNEMSGGEGQINWQKGIRANARFTREKKDFARFDMSTDEDLVSGPHDVEMSYRPSPSNEETLKMHHEIEKGKVNSSLVRMENRKQRPIGDVSGRGILDIMAGLYMKA